MTIGASPRRLPLGVVLAGGASRRMGRDKALLRLDRLDGRPALLERAVATLRVAGLEEVTVVVSTSERGQSLREALPRLCDTPFLTDEAPGCGPLGGLHAALRAFPGRDLLLVACDMPHLDARALRLLTAPSDDDIVAPRVSGRDQPLHARYGPACLPVATRLLQEGRIAMRDLLSAPTLRVRTLDDAELARHGVPARAFANVNTPADLAALADADG